MSKPAFLISEFERLYGAKPQGLARAPGRVNLIGEHTDYNDGFVMPIAIDRAIWFAARRRADRQVCVTALDIQGGQTDIFSVDEIQHHPNYHWANYVRGVAYLLQQRHVELVGLDVAITSEIPPGAGLASSAALEVGTAIMFQAFAETRLDKVTLARLCQQAENEFVGVKSGIMDQYASVCGEEGRALWIDCRALSYEAVPLPRGVTVVVADTMKKRDLAGSAYHTRRAECENATRLLGALLRRPIHALRDVSPQEFRAVERSLPPLLAKRARHVILENERVMQAARAAKENDATRLGQLMNESQASLVNDYEASSPELETMIALARRQPGCLGARLTGAGWGGATVNLVRDQDVQAFSENVKRGYRAQIGIEPWITAVRAAAGASWLPLADAPEAEWLR